MTLHTKYVNILHLTWESPTLLWTFKLLMREARPGIPLMLVIIAIIYNYMYISVEK